MTSHPTMSRYIPPSQRPKLPPKTYPTSPSQTYSKIGININKIKKKFKNNVLKNLNNEMKEHLRYNQYLNNKLYGITSKLSPLKEILNKNNYIDNESKNNIINCEAIPTPKTILIGSNNILSKSKSHFKIVNINEDAIKIHETTATLTTHSKIVNINAYGSSPPSETIPNNKDTSILTQENDKKLIKKLKKKLIHDKDASTASTKHSKIIHNPVNSHTNQYKDTTTTYRTPQLPNGSFIHKKLDEKMNVKHKSRWNNYAIMRALTHLLWVMYLVSNNIICGTILIVSLLNAQMALKRAEFNDILEVTQYKNTGNKLIKIITNQPLNIGKPTSHSNLVNADPYLNEKSSKTDQNIDVKSLNTFTHLSYIIV